MTENVCVQFLHHILCVITVDTPALTKRTYTITFVSLSTHPDQLRQMATHTGYAGGFFH